MPAIGFHIEGTDYVYDEAIEIARRNGHLGAFPPSALRAMVRTRVDGDWLSPSSADGCPRRRILEQQVEWYIDPEKEWRPGIGTAVHEWMWNRSPGEEHAERHLSTEIQIPLNDGRTVPFEIRGTPDLYDAEFRRVTDFKTVGDFRSNYPYDSHVLQVNLYAFLLEMNNLPVEHAIIWYVRQGGKDAKRQVVEVPLWGLEETYYHAVDLAKPLAWYRETGELPPNEYDPKWFPCMYCPVIAECQRRHADDQ